MRILLGIDTSNYKTSLAAVTNSGKVLYDGRIPLQVKEGKRGLRQSHAVFMHLKNLPRLTKDLCSKLDISRINGIAVSTRPRPLKDSYMPVFKAGEAFAEVIADLLKIKLMRVSHQESHIMAGYCNCNALNAKTFLCLHVSGGTTEILKAKIESNGFVIETLGGTQDLHAGQFIDRVGVSLGLDFPAGPALEKMALEAQKKNVRIPSAVKGNIMSFSGPESCARRLKNRVNANELAYAVFLCVAKTLTKLTKKIYLETGIKDALLVGGVMANQIIRDQLVYNLPEMNLYFADKHYSVDNAVGTALLAKFCEKD